MAFVSINPTFSNICTEPKSGFHNGAKCSMMKSDSAVKCQITPLVQVLKSTTGAILLSAAMFMSSDGMASLADEQPLIFDHDQTLMGADFKNRADLKGAIFSKANCKGAAFTGSDLTNAQLDDANMIGADLEGVTAVNVTATKTKFQKANLKNADFTNANLISAVMDGVDIEGADFSDSLLDKVTTLKLCKVAKGVHPKTGIPTAESLMCPE